ncbi:GSCOCG00010744001-RA-CDS [Cotesia congregata]|nr:GSCOCG00010744001-RA-CDS [Cotesia congregata]
MFLKYFLRINSCCVCFYYLQVISINNVLQP